jgi:hypothetical protein
MPRPTEKAKQATAQRESNSTRFTLVQPTTPFEASDEDQDPTYVYNSSGEEVWTDIEDEPATDNLAGDISALQTLYSKLLPPHMRSPDALNINNMNLNLETSKNISVTPSFHCQIPHQNPAILIHVACLSRLFTL